MNPPTTPLHWPSYSHRACPELISELYVEPQLTQIEPANNW